MGIDVHVALPPGGPMIDRYRRIGSSVHPLAVELPVRRPRRWPAVLSGLRQLVDSIEPDLVHVHNVGAAVAMRAALGKRHAVPRLFQVPGPLHLEHLPSRRLELASAGSADSWLASCEYTRRLYEAAGVPEERLGMSYYGTEVAAYSQGRPDRGYLRAELGVANETKIVGMVAYMYAPKRYLGQRRGLKGHEDLIDAVALGLQDRRDIVVVFIGGAWAGATSYERMVRSYGKERCGDRAFFLGSRADVAQLYGDIDVAVHPSHSENVGGAVESLLAAVPTVATAVGGLPELVRPGETGWLVPPRNPSRLRDAIASVLDNHAHAKRLALRGRGLATYLFDVRRTANEVAECYERILVGHSTNENGRGGPSV